MGTELTLRYRRLEELEQDFEANLRKGRAFVHGTSTLVEREYCVIRLEHPSGGAALCMSAEAVWIDPNPDGGGTGLSLLNFDAEAQRLLKAFVARQEVVGPGSNDPVGLAGAAASGVETSDASPSLRNVHDRILDLDATERDALARQAGTPERVALERRYGSSVWEGLLHNPQVTPREVLRMAKSSSLATSLVGLVVANKAWLADAAICSALLANPRVSGAHLERVLKALPQAELVRIAEQSSLRVQVRQGAKRLIRR